MGHEQRAATSSTVTDQRRKNFFVFMILIRCGIAYLKVAVQNPANASELEKFLVYPYWGYKSPIWAPIWGTYATVKAT